MYGLIEKIVATEGGRDALIEVLLEVSRDMPGCLSYVIAKDSTEADAIWVTEVWDGPHSHGAAQALPAVQAAITRSRALIQSFGGMTVTEPMGGHGLMGMLHR